MKDYLSIAFFDVDVEKHPNFIEEFEQFKKEVEGINKPLGESKIWMMLDNVHLLD